MAVALLVSNARLDGGDYAALETESDTPRILRERKQVTLGELPDEFFLKFISKKSSVLQKSSITSALAGSLISTDSEHTEYAKRQDLCEACQTTTSSDGEKWFNAVKAKDFQAVVKAAKLQGHDTKNGCKAVECGLGTAVVEGQRERRVAGVCCETESAVIVDGEELD
ncbi:hypothetical protein FS837_002496 [Tulasnella sp. UAMH 9824]|nr:hypothetical protein FS837_002496 [Tulasnella sp. UAMH 9824]